MNKKTYLVLSVSEIRHMLQLATKQAYKNNYKGRRAGRWCLVLKDIEVGLDLDGESQISSYSVSSEINRQLKELSL
jgi:hypothetical protein